MIPANVLIPPFVNNGGYDWDSWNPAYGPYPFWMFINQPPGQTPSDPQHPTCVEVYSDNHGEAMAYLNGDWNLDWDALWDEWVTYGAYDIPVDAIVGDTTIVAKADYPYMRKHPWLMSNEVNKTWTWGKDVRGPDPHVYKDGSMDPADYRMVFDIDGGDKNWKVAFVWVCDRDGIPAVGEEIQWRVGTTGCTAEIAAELSGTLSLVGGYTVDVTGGFLTNTDGILLDPPNRLIGMSRAKLPGPLEMALWDAVWPGEPCHHAVAAVVVESSLPCLVDLEIELDEGEQIGTVVRHTNLPLGTPEGAALGDSNLNGVVDMGDVTKTERIILELDDPTITADANQDGAINMGDVTTTERIILGV